VSDARAVIDDMYDAGDVVVVVDLRFAGVSHAGGGRIVSYHTYYDQLGLLTQLGVMAG
jgi:hypothetical protein